MLVGVTAAKVSAPVLCLDVVLHTSRSTGTANVLRHLLHDKQYTTVSRPHDSNHTWDRNA